MIHLEALYLAGDGAQADALATQLPPRRKATRG